MAVVVKSSDGSEVDPRSVVRGFIITITIYEVKKASKGVGSLWVKNFKLFKSF